MRRLSDLLTPQFLVYVLGGVLSAAVDIGVLQLLLMQGATAMTATSAGFAAGLLVNYAFHAKVTFSHIHSAAGVLRYLTLVAANYLLTLACVALSVRLCGHPLPGKVLSLPVVAVNGFLLGKYWVFR